MFMCVLSSCGSCFETLQAYFLVCQQVMLVFLSFRREMMMIWVVAVEFIVLVGVSRLCAIHDVGPHWYLCALLKILLVHWYSSCYTTFWSTRWFLHVTDDLSKIFSGVACLRFSFRSMLCPCWHFIGLHIDLCILWCNYVIRCYELS